VAQPKVFLSYSHRYRRWADRLLIHLRAITGTVEVWSDSNIKSGKVGATKLREPYRPPAGRRSGGAWPEHFR
jgi:hypothetical protein